MICSADVEAADDGGIDGPADECGSGGASITRYRSQT